MLFLFLVSYSKLCVLRFNIELIILRVFVFGVLKWMVCWFEFKLVVECLVKIWGGIVMLVVNMV